jgi:hypothetical protein
LSSSVGPPRIAFPTQKIQRIFRSVKPGMAPKKIDRLTKNLERIALEARLIGLIEVMFGSDIAKLVVEAVREKEKQ